jgi:Uma2 family endonuclease
VKREQEVNTPMEKLITAEEYARWPDLGKPSELVRGKIVLGEFAPPRHGQICTEVMLHLGNSQSIRSLGHLVALSSIITERNPDTVRGADFSFYSYVDFPPGPLPWGYLNKPPQFVLEVLSPDDRRCEMLTKAAEYLNTGVQVVCVLDPEDEKAYIYHAEKPERILTADQEFSVPNVLPDFRVPVKAFFE